VFAVKLLVIAAYAVTNSTSCSGSRLIWVTATRRLGLVAVWSGMMTVAIVLVGSLTDAIGLRKTFFWASGSALLLAL